MSSDPTTARRGSRLSRRTLLVAAMCALAILVAAAFAWGFVADKQDESEAAEVVEQFRDAVNARDFRTACSLLASTAPPRARGVGLCASRLRKRKDMVAQWEYLLPGELEAEIEERSGGRIYAIVFQKETTIFDAGPRHQFTFVEENGNLRLEHFLGRF